MNFKTIFGVTLFAFLSTIKAAPTVDIHNGYASLPVLNETYEDAKKGCSSIAADLYSSKDKSTYACLQLYMADREFKLITPKDAVCFYGNNKPYCVNSKYSNIEECSLTSEKYNYESCIKKLINSPLNIQMSFRDFNTKEKIISSPVIDSRECKGNNGIYLLNDATNYACIVKENWIYDPVTKGVCVKVQLGSEKEKIYCINEENTSINECLHNSESYDYRECARKLVKLGNNVPYTISAYEFYDL
ncbi:hypothetical protein BCR36DRAFT_583727 [Piromyces finnis]|uniref:Uncharacterized protein n=1 Tax=Piromyces finnis TaxID=1754191 RepID=A0A1Y1VA73_9FUNG|nr:hypothetical protein BCR36DRAFT_583727 [Piromyces finnis]|eukprot:ORX49654.1 hypothetical protein BCR36DRAFT_583727 [Piromyces finnis]